MMNAMIKSISSPIKSSPKNRLLPTDISHQVITYLDRSELDQYSFSSREHYHDRDLDLWFDAQDSQSKYIHIYHCLTHHSHHARFPGYFDRFREGTEPTRFKVLLRRSIDYSKLDAIRSLLKKAAPEHHDDIKEKFIYAAGLGHHEVLECMIPYISPSDIHNCMYASLKNSCRNGHINVFDFILSRVDISHCLNELFDISFSHGNLQLADKLLLLGADINDQASLRLKHFIRYRNTEAIIWLIERGIDFHLLQEEPLKLAIIEGAEEIVAILLDKGANADEAWFQTKISKHVKIRSMVRSKMKELSTVDRVIEKFIDLLYQCS